jgi:hypothetical protein
MKKSPPTAFCRLLAGFSLGLDFDPEAQAIFFSETSGLSPNYTAFYPSERTFHSHCCENHTSSNHSHVSTIPSTNHFSEVRFNIVAYRTVDKR